ncbi:MAG: class I SAM-dependent methyltransferase, partial [Gammaproteobacteria bacterium]
MDDKTAEIVNQQYEQYPYPYREAEHEKERLLSPGMSDLPLVNSLGFKGKADISKFRVLIAGGGTGDAVIFLAEQLKT